MPAQPGPPRVSGRVLAAATAAVLGAGTWWWVAAAPEPPPDPPPDPLGPATAGVLWHISERIEDGGFISWDGITAGERYKVRFACLGGAGELRIGVGARGWSNEERYPCTPEVLTMWFSAGAGGALRLSLVGTSATVSVQVTPA